MIAIDSRTAHFIQVAHRAPRLSREDERELVVRLREGDRAAKDRLVTCHLREVAFIALKYQRYGVAVADLIAEGNLGLLRAVEKFDLGHNVRFATYAAHWIRSYVVSHVLGSWSIVCPRTGVLRTKTFFKLRRERAKLEGLGLDCDDTNQLLAERMGVTQQKVERMLARIDSRDLSLEAPAHGDSKATLGDMFASADNPEKACDDHRIFERLNEAVEKALEVLDERERFIVDSRWLADPDDQISLADIGRKLGVSRERARQLEARARERVARALAKAGGIDREWLDATAA
ncbi:MAG TPA: sigma-70 family RNA polymerase sigma factor [Polyangiaceae bacterium]|jgi:RNA polymerase sigma-32 factor|nr:sigma-70 family RNA polymerase sigma factor [Polyangiaceae bacterium]